jgi:hypothetical protein
VSLSDTRNDEGCRNGILICSFSNSFSTDNKFFLQFSSHVIIE